jgi:hypothetical protein
MEKRMRVGKTVLRVGLVVVLVGLAVAGVLYWQASRVPDAYQPAELTQAERLQAAKNFGQHLSDFNSIAQNTVAGEWQITQTQLNQYLASMDEIAWYSGSSKRGDVHRQMDQAGISAPAAALSDGVLTLMLRARDYNKIVSADITFTYTGDRKLKVRLAQARVGKLAIPARLVRDRLDVLKKALSRQEAKNRRSTAAAGADGGKGGKGSDVAAEDIGRLLGGLIGAIDEDPIKPEFVMRLGRKRVRIDAIRIEPGLATLEITPLGPAKRKKG